MPSGELTRDRDFSPRILSIDGGGLKGAMPAALLAEIEETYGIRVADHFDLIVGTSTGGIIAIGLGLGLSAAEILSFYEKDGPTVFGQRPSPPPSLLAWCGDKVSALRRSARQAVKPKYDPAALEQALVARLRDRRLGESTTRLVIPAYNSVERTVYLYKTCHHERFRSDYRRRAVDVALATSAAPTYFPAHESEHATGLRDGGVWANDPAGVAVVEGHAVLEWNMRRARVLSLGCTAAFMVFDATAGYWSKGSIPGMRVIELLMQGQAKGSQSTAKLMLGHPHTNADGLLRVDVDVPEGWASLDDASRIGRLVALGRSLARTHGPEIERLFLAPGRAMPFTPVYPLEGRTDVTATA